MSAIGSQIWSHTKGRPYVFHILSFTGQWDVSAAIEDLTTKKLGMAFMHADHIKSGGFDLLDKVHASIEEATVIVADITDPRSNIFYELGYAVAKGKKPVLIAAIGDNVSLDVPSDLKGLLLIRYQHTPFGLETLKNELAETFRQRLEDEPTLVRDMLEAPKSTPAYVIASPKYPPPVDGPAGKVFSRRTYGDHLGILGLVAAFGSILGHRADLHLVSGQDCDPALFDEDLNLYVIGSCNSNNLSKRVMAELQRDQQTTWVFNPVPGKADENGCPVVLCECHGGAAKPMCGVYQAPENHDSVRKPGTWIEDYGLILRGPHPLHPDRIMMVLAGAHALGTGAACLAATRPDKIREIRAMMPKDAMEDKRQLVSVLVKGTAAVGDYHLDGESVEVVKVWPAKADAE